MVNLSQRLYINSKSKGYLRIDLVIFSGLIFPLKGGEEGGGTEPTKKLSKRPSSETFTRN